MLPSLRRSTAGPEVLVLLHAKAMVRRAIVSCALAGVVFGPLARASQTQSQTPQNSPSTPLSKSLGTIQSISGSALALKLDDGSNVNVSVPDSSRIVRIAPGEKDLKDAVPIRMQDLQVGDRVLVRGMASGDKKSLNAAIIVVMKKTDVDAKQQKEREEWQKHGIGGLVNATDVPEGTVTISVTSAAGKKEVVIHSSKSTLVRRYAPDSVKFDDAKPSTLQDIKTGDQLRARGARSEDGTSFTAEEIVFGSFRNIAGTVSAVDAADGSDDGG